jgi:hypothetical protein
VRYTTRVSINEHVDYALDTEVTEWYFFIAAESSAMEKNSPASLFSFSAKSKERSLGLLGLCAEIFF